MSRRMYPRVLTVGVFAALIVGVTASSAAEDREIHQGNSRCVSNNGRHTLGVALFTFTQGSVSVVGNIKHGLPNTHYRVILLNADTCTEIASSKGVKTNANGKARRTVKADGSHGRFEIDAYDVDHDIHNISDPASN